MYKLNTLRLTVQDSLSNEQSICLAEVEETTWSYPDAKHAQSVFAFDSRDLKFRIERLREVLSLLAKWGKKTHVELLTGEEVQVLSGTELEVALAASLETVEVPPITIHPGERQLLDNLVRSGHAAANLRKYIFALKNAGDSRRAGVVSAVADAIGSDEPDQVLARLEAIREVLTDRDADWARLVGLELTIEIAKHYGLAHLQQWLAYSLPAQDLKWRRADPSDQSGTTRFFGDPDLPPDMSWPTLGDCTDFFQVSANDIPKESSCRFVCQIDLRDFQEIPTFSHLEGMLTVFSFSEYERFGISEIFLKHIPEGTSLERRAHPELGEANSRQPERRVILTPTLTFPESYDGPWSEELEAAAGDPARVPRSPAARFGALGHTMGTTGADPSPGKEWQRLLCIPTDSEMVTWHHIAIPREDLQHGHFENWRGVWVDLDG